MYVYAPSWFFIKSHPRLVDAAKNFFQLIKLSAVLRQDEKRVFQRIMQVNCFSAHPESILIAMLTDDDPSVRKRAVLKILKIRKKKISDSVRKFVLPKIKFNATSYIDIIDWKVESFTEPPLTMSFTRNQLLKSVKSGEILIFPDIPNNTQGVERMIKLVTDASKTVHDHDKRHFHILQTLKSRASLTPAICNTEPVKINEI